MKVLGSVSVAVCPVCSLPADAVTSHREVRTDEERAGAPACS